MFERWSIRLLLKQVFYRYRCLLVITVGTSIGYSIRTKTKVGNACLFLLREFGHETNYVRLGRLPDGRFYRQTPLPAIPQPNYTW